ncbi:GlcG/HbpS family heme-binding protein [Kerstersia gyiorum]|uniref:Uncharacterized protein GlcG (DUF336 family) n=2 Tax=Kerstersia gyiorum TaxID=206506 RepID=A0A4Q7MPC3_9BURK|nr:heme-binding protein [Kerstersia gyiorum]KAB0544359.1 heme-binding protein [Kerstersia gyiorum]RZS69468.1 uncharacterized protein GlcG (DUF336 family) [Kerstersia gyiorum]
MSTPPIAGLATEAAARAGLTVARTALSARAIWVMTDAALRQAEALGIEVNIAVADAAGLLVGFIRQPGAPLHSIDIAIDKAYTSASFGLATGQWPEALQSHSPAVRDGLLRRPRFVAFGGGLPIEIDSQRLGGIGVSGGSEAQDEIIAGAGLAALAQEY